MPGASFTIPLAFAAFGVRVSDGAMTAGGSNPYVLNSATAAFTIHDVGKKIVVEGAGAAGADLTTTIKRLRSASAVELKDPALTTVTGSDLSYVQGVYRLSNVISGGDIDGNTYQHMGKLRRLQIAVFDDSPGGSLFVGGPYVTPDNYGTVLSPGSVDDFAPSTIAMAMPSSEYVCSDVADQIFHLHWTDDLNQSTQA